MVCFFYRNRFIGVCSSFLLLPVMVAIMLLEGGTSAAPPTKAKSKGGLPPFPVIEKQYVATVGAEGAVIKVGDKVTLTPAKGPELVDAEIVELIPGKESNTLKSLTVQVPKVARKQFFPMAQVTKIEKEAVSYEVLLDPEKKFHVLIDTKKRDVDVEARLRTKRHRLWVEPTDEEQEKAVKEHKVFLERVAMVYPSPPFTLHETKYFLFYTDMPNNQVGGYIANLDTMYRELCKAFGIPKDKNIWKGKCVVVAFVEPEAFHNFERTLMNNVDSGRAQGLCHNMGDGRVIMSCYRGNDPAYFATVLVHETSHGFLYRLRSSVHVPSWINEGVADWVAGVTVPASPEVQRRQARSVDRMKNTNSMGGNFFDNSGTNIDGWQYGIASSMTHALLTLDPLRYRAFILGIKDGLEPFESLKEAYGMSPTDLVQFYGQSVGVPDLMP